jgi:signal transduction histidine kinase
MSSWAVVAMVAIIVWGVVDYAKARAGIVTDEYGNEKIAPRDDDRAAAELESARRELADLKDRVKVLERIATESNSTDARERARIAAEIEALRTLPDERKKEQSE